KIKTPWASPKYELHGKTLISKDNWFFAYSFSLDFKASKLYLLASPEIILDNYLNRKLEKEFIRAKKIPLKNQAYNEILEFFANNIVNDVSNSNFTIEKTSSFSLRGANE